MGNIKSVSSVLKYLGEEPRIVNTPSKLKADSIVIPGVGAFGDGMNNLKPFIPKIRKALASGVPLLGICLGMQMFFERSEEARTPRGLGIMKGKVTKIRTRLKVPHIGWNSIRAVKRNCPLFRRISEGYVYFAHSYHAQPREDVVAATTDYGCKITASVWKGKVFGVQFHPEKSGQLGLRVLSNFLDL